MEDYELKINENRKRNKKYIDEFESWLNEKKLTEKTIKKHISNVDLYVNDYLNYYDVIKVEEGVDEVTSFLGGWFIEKCMWASRTSLKETASSLKKFYQFMCEKDYVNEEDYKMMCDEIKERMDDFIRDLDAFDNGTYYDFL